MNGDSFTTQLQSSMLLSLGLDHWNPKQVGSYSCNFPPVSSEILWDVFHIVSHPLKIPNLPLRQHCSLRLPDIILEVSAGNQPICILTSFEYILTLVPISSWPGMESICTSLLVLFWEFVHYLSTYRQLHSCISLIVLVHIKQSF